MFEPIVLVAFLGGVVPALLWSTLLVILSQEEVFKFGAAYLAALRWGVFDEPLDAVIYLVTAALGFAALENVLFIITPLESGNWLQTIITGDLRFVGATLLHTLCSATIGLAIAFTFYKSAFVRKMAALGGVILATALHAAFNLSIINNAATDAFKSFAWVWGAVVILIILFEEIKAVKPRESS